MMEEIRISAANILPELILILGVFGVVLAVSFKKPESKLSFYLFALIIVSYFFLVQLSLGNADGKHFFHQLLFLDIPAIFIKQLAALSAMIFMVHARIMHYKYAGEIYALILFILLGISFLSMTTHFITMYVSIELISLSSYVLVASDKLKKNFEAAIKYLIFGATSTAIMLYGISLFYGISHELDFSSATFLDSVSKNPSLAIQAISFMVLGGLFFKIAAAPFHQWIPDVYESTSTPIVSFLSFAPKAAGFLIISRFVSADFVDLTGTLVLIVVLSLVIGNFAALWQNNFKRMLAYSGIAQSGFILIGLVGTKDSDFYGTFFYILAYLPITMGAFLLADYLSLKVGSFHIPNFAGLGKKYPILTINAVIITISLIGLPPTIGFMAKLVVFSSLANQAFENSNMLLYGLLVFGLLNAAIAIYYYLRPAYFMILKEEDEHQKSRYFQSITLTLVLSYFGAILIFFFIYPNFLSDWVQHVVENGFLPKVRD